MIYKIIRAIDEFSSIDKMKTNSPMNMIWFELNIVRALNWYKYLRVEIYRTDDWQLNWLYKINPD